MQNAENWQLKIMCITIIPQLTCVYVLPKVPKYSYKYASDVKQIMIAESSLHYFSLCSQLI